MSLNIVDDCSICGKEFNLLTASAEWRLEVERSPGSRKFKCFCSQECHDAAKAALLLKCYGEPDEYTYRVKFGGHFHVELTTGLGTTMSKPDHSWAKCSICGEHFKIQAVDLCFQDTEQVALNCTGASFSVKVKNWHCSKGCQEVRRAAELLKCYGEPDTKKGPLDLTSFDEIMKSQFSDVIADKLNRSSILTQLLPKGTEKHAGRDVFWVPKEPKK